MTLIISQKREDKASVCALWSWELTVGMAVAILAIAAAFAPAITPSVHQKKKNPYPLTSDTDDKS